MILTDLAFLICYKTRDVSPYDVHTLFNLVRIKGFSVLAGRQEVETTCDTSR